MTYSQQNAFRMKGSPEGAHRSGKRQRERADALEKQLDANADDLIGICLDSYRKREKPPRSKDSRGRRANSFAGTEPAAAQARPVLLLRDEWRVDADRETRRRPRRRQRRNLLTALAWALMVFAMSFAALAFAPQQVDRLATGAIRAMTAPEDAFVAGRPMCPPLEPVLDESGRVLGHQPSECAAEIGFAFTSISDEEAVSKIAAAMEVLEGRIDGPFTPAGIDLRGPARALAAIPAHFLGESPLIGGSPPMLSAYEHRSGIDYPAAADVEQIVRKAAAYARAAVFTAHHAPSRKQRERFVAEGFSCMTGQPGTQSAFGPALGGEFCATLLGRNSLEGLSWPEAFFIAAAARYPAWAPGEAFDDDARGKRDARHAYLTARAKSGLRTWAEARGITPAALASMENEIDAIPPLDPLSGRGPGLRNGVLEGAWSGLAGESMSGGSVTLEPKAQALAATLGRELAVTLAASAEETGLCFGAACPSEKRVELLVALAEVGQDGALRLRGLSQSHSGLLWGPQNVKARPSAGSLNKAILAPLILRHGIGTACARPFGGIRNYDGFSGAECAGPAAEMSIAEALGVSDNLALIDAVNRLNPEDVRAYLEALGFSVLGQGPELDVAGVVLGYAATPTPAILMRAFAAIQTGAEVGPLQMSREANRERLSVASLTSVVATSQARLALAAPLTMANGTARHAAPALAEAGCSGAMAKTGTVDAVQPADAVAAKLVLLSATCNGREFTALVRIAGPNGHAITGVSSRLTSSIAARLIVGSR